MRRLLFRIYSLVIAGCTGLILFNSHHGPIQLLLWVPKLLVSAVAPWLALLSGINTGVGLKTKDRFSTAVGFIGAVIALKHVVDVTRSWDEQFAAAFGADWEARIPPDLRHRLRSYRWLPFYRRRRPGALHLNVVYGTNSETGQPVVADLMQPPPGIEPSGVGMIFAHGGGWWYGRKNIQKFPFFGRLVSQGHIVMDIDYTLASKASVESMVEEVRQAVRWLKQRPHPYGFAIDQVVLTGQSAGAQLMLLAAYQADDQADNNLVDGVISYCGPTDMISLHHDIQSRFFTLVPGQLVDWAHQKLGEIGGPANSLARGIAGLLGGTPEEIPDVYQSLSPTSHVRPGCPPTLLFYCSHDLLVSHRDGDRLYRLLQQADVPTIYVLFPNCDHAFEAVLPRLSPPAQTAAYYTERFLAAIVNYRRSKSLT